MSKDKKAKKVKPETDVKPKEEDVSTQQSIGDKPAPPPNE